MERLVFRSFLLAPDFQTSSQTSGPLHHAPATSACVTNKQYMGQIRALGGNKAPFCDSMSLGQASPGLYLTFPLADLFGMVSPEGHAPFPSTSKGVHPQILV